MGFNTNISDRKPSVAGVAIDVVSGKEIEDLAVSGVVTISTNTAFILKSDTLSLDQRFVIENGVELSFVGYLGYATIVTCTNVGTFISGSGSIKISDCLFASTVASQLFDISDGIHVINKFAFVGWGFAGVMDDSKVSISLGEFISIGAGFSFEDSTVIMGDVLVTAEGMAGAFVDIPTQRAPASITFDAVSGATLTETLIRVDPDIEATTTINIRNCPLWGTLYDTTTGASNGTFSAVTDSFVSLLNIESVSDSSGTARFHGVFTGFEVFEGQSVIISGYVTNTGYNGLGKISARDESH